MNDLSQHNETISNLRSALEDVHYERPTPVLPDRSTALVRTALVTLAIVTGGIWLFSTGAEPVWADAGRAPTAAETVAITDQCKIPISGTPVLQPLMAAEIRGRTGSFVYADDASYVVCIAQDFATDGEKVSIDVVSTSSSTDMADGNNFLQFDLLTVGDESGGANTWIVGRIQPKVDRVVIKTPTFGEFEATVGDGWFTVWWPTTESFEIIATDEKGDELARLSPSS